MTKPRARCVYLALLPMRDHKTMETPSITYGLLCKITKLSRRSVIDAMAELREVGAVETVSGGQGYRRGTIYRLPLGKGQ